MSNSSLQTFLSRLVRRENLTQEEARQLLDALLDEAATDAQIAALSWPLRRRVRLSKSWQA